MTSSQIVESAIDGYERESAASEVVETKSEIVRGKDACADAAREYAAHVAPRVISRDIIVETPLRALLEDDELGIRVDLVGTPDRVEGHDIGDVKTGRRLADDAIDTSRQLAVYDLLHESESGAPSRSVYFDNVYRSGKVWKSDRLVSHRTESDRSAIWEILVRATNARTQGVALPAPEGAWWCSRKWCPHWRACPAVVGKRSRDDES
jgi:hypothetical protein